jgi:hypothetical protein
MPRSSCCVVAPVYSMSSEQRRCGGGKLGLALFWAVLVES